MSKLRGIILLGDFNARIGSNPDFIPNLDSLPKREFIEKTVISKVKNS